LEPVSEDHDSSQIDEEDDDDDDYDEDSQYPAGDRF